jgi:23S rRNA (pseudouridine1915-N3)-methyltransferase
MKVLIIAVGKIKEKYLQDGIAEYLKRIRPYIKLNILELTEEKRPAPATSSIESAAMEKEGKRIAVIPETYVIAMM